MEKTEPDRVWKTDMWKQFIGYQCHDRYRADRQKTAIDSLLKQMPANE